MKPGLPAHAQILSTVKHCARSPPTNLHIHLGKIIPMIQTSTEPGLPTNAQIPSTVKHCTRSPATTLHVHAAQSQHGKTIYFNATK